MFVLVLLCLHCTFEYVFYMHACAIAYKHDSLLRQWIMYDVNAKALHQQKYHDVEAISYININIRNNVEAV